MAQKITTLDDLNQEEGAETFRFTAGGKVCEIDLVEANVAKFWTAIKRFTDKGRDITPTRRDPSTDVYSTVDQGAVRDWAKEQGLPYNQKGKVPLDLVYAYKRPMATTDGPTDEDDQSDSEDEPSATQPDESALVA